MEKKIFGIGVIERRKKWIICCKLTSKEVDTGFLKGEASTVWIKY